MQWSELRASRPAGLPAAASGAAGSRSLTFIDRPQMTTPAKSRVWIWLLVVLIAGGVVGFAIGSASSGIKRVSGREFLAYAAPEPAINSAFSATLIGAPLERAYLEYWSGVPHLGPASTVIWTPLSELPVDIAQQLRDGKNPWANRSIKAVEPTRAPEGARGSP